MTQDQKTKHLAPQAPRAGTFAWLGRCRRLAKEWEKSIESAEAWVLIAHIRRITRLIARG